MAVEMIIAVLIVGGGLALCIREAWAIIRRRRARSEQSATIYEVGSPEYNQQIIQTLHQVNERLAPQGKRVPERVAIDIIMQHQEESE